MSNLLANKKLWQPYRHIHTHSTTTEDLDTAADHLAGTAAHQLQEANILIAQLDTTHTASTGIDEAPHHITLTLLPSQDPMQHQILTQMRNKQNPEEDPHPLPSCPGNLHC